MCWDQDQASRTEKFIAGLLAIVIVFAITALLVNNCAGQQPNTYRAGMLINGGVTAGTIPTWGSAATAGGPFVAQAASGGVSATLWVGGAAGMAFEVWGHATPPAASGTSGVGGICDLDFNATWSKLFGNTFLGVAGDQYQTTWGIPVTIPGSPSYSTVQAWVSDPTRSDGVRLSGCVYVWN